MDDSTQVQRSIVQSGISIAQLHLLSELHAGEDQGLRVYLRIAQTPISITQLSVTCYTRHFVTTHTNLSYLFSHHVSTSVEHIQPSGGG